MNLEGAYSNRSTEDLIRSLEYERRGAIEGPEEYNRRIASELASEIEQELRRREAEIPVIAPSERVFNRLRIRIRRFSQPV